MHAGNRREPNTDQRPRSGTVSSALFNINLVSVIAFMVSVLFTLLMATEMVYQEVTDWISRRKEKSQDDRNPADLVGTFSRYK